MVYLVFENIYIYVCMYVLFVLGDCIGAVDQSDFHMCKLGRIINRHCLFFYSISGTCLSILFS